MILEIIKIGNPVLNKISKEITDFKKLPKLIDDLFETMYGANGIGIAAVQVNILKRVFVVDIPKTTVSPMIFVNPIITKTSNDLFYYEEGCLSIPKVLGLVGRPRSIKLSYQDHKGKTQELIVDEVLATCIQHEIDHLNGILFTERIDRKEIKKVKTSLLENNFPIQQLANKTY